MGKFWNSYKKKKKEKEKEGTLWSDKIVVVAHIAQSHSLALKSLSHSIKPQTPLQFNSFTSISLPPFLSTTNLSSKHASSNGLLWPLLPPSFLCFQTQSPSLYQAPAFFWPLPLPIPSFTPETISWYSHFSSCLVAFVGSANGFLSLFFFCPISHDFFSYGF